MPAVNPDMPGLLAFLAAAGLAVARTARPDLRAWWAQRRVFLALLAAALFLGQRDALRANFQLWNPDESQMIAGALVLSERPVFWRDVDGTTHGPLNQWPLLLPALVGARVDYTSARVVGALLTILLLSSLLVALARRMPEGLARLLVLPGWALFIFNQDPEISQYTSELPPALLLMIAVALLPAAGPVSARRLFAVGLCCGAAPFAKLQVAPSAAWLLVAAAIIAFRSSRGRGLGALLAGAALPALLFVGSAAAAGAFADFRIRYLETNLLGYAAQGRKYFNNEPPRPDMLFGFGWFLWPVAGAAALAIVGLFRARTRPDRGFLALAAGLVATTLFAIYFPNKPFAHYFLLLVTPLLLLLGAAAAPWLGALLERASTLRRAGIAVALLAVLAAPVVMHHFRHPGYLRAILPTRAAVPRPLIEALQRHTRPGDGLAVWGWQPALYVFTQTVSATPDLIVFWQAVPSARQEFYQARYLRVLAARPPVAFVDTMGPADFFFFRRGTEVRHERFAALRDFINANYTLVETVSDSRIYLRRDLTARFPP